GSYSFEAAAGEGSGRLEIVYKLGTVLATNGGAKDLLKIYRENDQFVVKSESRRITQLELYDTSGKLMLKTIPNSTKTAVNSQSLPDGVYILRIFRGVEVVTRKIMR